MKIQDLEKKDPSSDYHTHNFGKLNQKYLYVTQDFKLYFKQQKLTSFHGQKFNTVQPRIRKNTI